MNICKKYMLYIILGSLAVSSANIQCFSFLDKLYWSHYMSKLSEKKQHDGFLLNDLEFEIRQIWALVGNRDQQGCAQSINQNTSLELSDAQFPFHLCLDIELNHNENQDTLTTNLIALIQTFNATVDPITAANIATLNDKQVAAVKKAYDELYAFTQKYGIQSANTREVIKDIQKNAKANNAPAPSILNKEYVLPVVTAVALIGGYYIWQKWLSHKFWSWWDPTSNPNKPLANNDIKIGNASCKGEELALSKNVGVVQVRVTPQLGNTCGQHALLNTATILGSLQNPQLHAQLNDENAKLAKITEMKNNLLASANAKVNPLRQQMLNKANNPATFTLGDLPALAEFLARIKKITPAQLAEFKTIHNQINQFETKEALHPLIDIKNNFINNTVTPDAAKLQLVTALQPLSDFDKDTFGHLPQQAQQMDIAQGAIEALQDQVNQTQNQYRAAKELALRNVLAPAIQQLTQQEKDLFANTQARINDNFNGDVELIGSGPIEELLQTHYQNYNPHDKNSGQNGTISVIEAPNQYIPTPEQLQEGAAKHPKILGIELFSNIKKEIAQPGEYTHGFVLGDMVQTGDNTGSQGHWITLIVHKAADGTLNFIIADSLNSRKLTSNNTQRVIACIRR